LEEKQLGSAWTLEEQIYNFISINRLIPQKQNTQIWDRSLWRIGRAIPVLFTPSLHLSLSLFSLALLFLFVSSLHHSSFFSSLLLRFLSSFCTDYIKGCCTGDKRKEKKRKKEKEEEEEEEEKEETKSSPQYEF